MPLCVILRSLQLVFALDGETGFFKRGSEIGGMVLMGAIAVFVLALGVFGLSANRSPKKMPENRLLAVGSLAAAAGLIYEFAVAVYPVRVPGWQVAFVKGMGGAAAIFFVHYALTKVTGIKMPKGLFALPVVYALAKLLVVFTEFSSIALISDGAISVVSCCAVLVFFLQIAKQSVDIRSGKSHKLLLASGLVAAAMCLISSVPNLVVRVVATDNGVHDDLTTVITLLGLSVFILIFVFSFFANANLDEPKPGKIKIRTHRATTYFSVNPVIESKTSEPEVTTVNTAKVELDERSESAPKGKSPFKDEFINEDNNSDEDEYDSFSRINFKNI